MNDRIKYIRIKRNMAILLAGIALVMTSCKNDMKKVKEFSNMEKLPGMTAEDFEAIYSDSAVIRFKMKTPKFINYDQSDPPFTEFPTGIHIEQYDAHMNITASLKANYAKRFEKEGRWEARNNVVAVNQDGDTLKTEQLTWNEKTKKISSDEFVKIIHQNEIFSGIGMEASQDFTAWKIIKPTGTIEVDMQSQQQPAQ